MINFISKKSCFLCYKHEDCLPCSKVQHNDGSYDDYHYHTNCFLESADTEPKEEYTKEQWKQLVGDMYVLTDNHCVESIYGSKHWYLSGQLHRTDGPAVEYINGNKHWYLSGKLHRTDGPACEYASGDKYWYLNNKLHRTGGPAIEYANGDKYWYLNGRFIKKNIDKNDDI